MNKTERIREEKTPTSASQEEPPAPVILWLFRFAERIVVNPFRTIPLVGLVLYGVLRLSIAIFYSRFGFAPEDVGYGYVETLARSLYGLGAYVLLLVLIEYGIPLVGASLMRVYNRIRRQESEPIRKLLFVFGGPNRTLALFFFILFWPAIYLAGQIGHASTDGRAAQMGKPVSYSITSPYQAEAAVVHYLRPSARSPLMDGQCVLLLGEADGLLALYDPEAHASFRVPAGSVVVETGGGLKDVAKVPTDCPE